MVADEVSASYLCRILSRRGLCRLARCFDHGGTGDYIESVRHGPIVVMTGDEPRKNTFGGLAGVAAATSEQASRDVVVLGMAGQGVRVHHWSIAAAMRPGEAVTAERITDEEMAELLSRARCVVVPSFDEGLSLPVIEAVRSGAPVVASDIPAHVELIGRGDFLADPTSPADMCRAIRTALRRPATCRSQRSTLERHSHGSLEQHVNDLVKSLREHSQRCAPPVADRRRAIDYESHSPLRGLSRHRAWRISRQRSASSWRECAT